MGDELSLLWKLRADNTQSKTVVADTRKDIASLRQTFGSEFAQIQSVGRSALASITTHLSGFAGQVPLVGGAIKGLSRDIGDLDRAGTSAGRSLSSLIGPASLVAIGAAAFGVQKLVTEVFQLLEASSKLGGQIFDLSQKTGLGAERITALKFATEQSGGSIEKLTNGIKLFALTISDANKGSEEAINKLKRLGVEPKQGIFDLDAALNKALGTIAKAPSGIVQMTLAADAFGKKVGPELIPTIVSFDGNLDALTDRARKLGVTLTDVEAEQLDSFGDALDTLRLQATLMAAHFAAEVAPEITSAFQRISTQAGDNKSAIQEWGRATAEVFRGVRELAESELGQVVLKLAEIVGTASVATLAVKAARRAGAEARESDPGEDPFGPGGAARGGRKSLPGTPEHREDQERRARLEAAKREIEEFRKQLEESGKKSGGGRKPADNELKNAIQEAQIVERVAQQQIEADIAENQRAFQQQARDIEEFTRRAIELADEQLNAVIDRINSEYDAYVAALNKKKIKRDEFDRKDKELTAQTREAVQKNSDEVFRLEAERDQKISASEIAANQRSQQREEEAAQRTIDRIKRRIDLGVLLETEGERQIADIIDEGFRRRIELLREEETAVATSAERRAFIADEIIRLDGERAGAAEAAANRIADAIEREIQAERLLGDELLDIQETIIDLQREAAAGVIRELARSFASRKEIIRKQRDLELAEEDDRHRRVTASIDRQRQEVDREIELLEERIKSLRIGTTEEIEQHDRLIRSLEALRQKREQLNQQQDAENKKSQTRKRRTTDDAQAALDLESPIGGFLSGLHSGQLKDLEDGIKSFEDAVVVSMSAVGAAVNGVAQAVGQMVHAWVLLGEGAGSFRKFAAEVIASVAQMAIVKAVFEAAEALAMLALAYFTGNPKYIASAKAHGLAALAYGAVGGVAAGAGRGIAGDLFKQPSGGGIGADSGRDRPEQLNPLTLQRNASVRPINVTVVMQGSANKLFDFEVKKTIISDYTNGGPIREVIQSDGSNRR